MVFFISILCCIGFIELFFRIGVITRIFKIRDIASRVILIIRSPSISDHWKEKVLPRYSWRLFYQSLFLFITLIAAFSPFFIMLVVSVLVHWPIYQWLKSLYGIITITVFSVSYSVVRSRFV